MRSNICVMLDVCCFLCVVALELCFCHLFFDVYFADIEFCDVKIPFFEISIARYSMYALYHSTYMYTLLDQ